MLNLQRQTVKRFVVAALAAGMSWAMAGNAQAQTALQPFLTCKKVQDDAKRLACFDQAAEIALDVRLGTPDTATAAAQSAPAPAPAANALSQKAAELDERERALKAREEALAIAAAGKGQDTDKQLSLFGLPMPFAGGKDDLEKASAADKQVVERDEDGIIAAIESQVADWSYSPTQYLVFVLANGQVWKQVDGRQRRLRESETYTARIERGVFGSYLLRLNNDGAALPVRRIDGKKKKS